MKKKQNMVTTSFNPSFRRYQHCNGRGSHLCSAASFVQNQRLPYKLVDQSIVKCPSANVDATIRMKRKKVEVWRHSLSLMPNRKRPPLASRGRIGSAVPSQSSSSTPIPCFPTLKPALEACMLVQVIQKRSWWKLTWRANFLWPSQIHF